MVLQETQTQTKSPTCGLDFLYCKEEILVDFRLTKFEEEEDEEQIEPTISSPFSSPSLSSLSSSSSSSYNDDSDDVDVDDNELAFLISKEEKEQLSFDQTPLMVLASFRKGAVEWMMMVNTHFGFSTVTLVLAVNYFDRFVLESSQPGSFHKIAGVDDQHCTARIPWVAQLVSVACLSLACKVEETHVPLLLDFQIDCKYVFQAKSIKKMELLVLSTLEWKMNPVTPFSYFEHLTRRLRWKAHLQWQILRRSENLILSLIADPGYLCYPPSVVAAAMVLHAMGELEVWSPTEPEILVMDAFKIRKDKVEECFKFISELTSSNQNRKRRRLCSSPSR